MEWVWLIIVGAVVGALWRFLLPGRDPMGWLATIVMIFSGFWQYVIGVIVAIALVWLYGRIMGDRSRVATAP